VRREEVAADVVEQERSIYRAQAANSGKPAQVVEKIVDGKVEKFLADVCLLEQPFVKDTDKTVGGLVTDAIARLGENLVGRRFARFQLGEQSSGEN
jgi:elongation factor Ts